VFHRPLGEPCSWSFTGDSPTGCCLDLVIHDVK
jgi:hypothetical protein